MGLADALISVLQSERGGEVAQRGFDYQTCWALSEMLEYELDGKDYVFIFEYHDDVLILDRESEPLNLTIAQVKTRKNHWTLTPLHKPAKGKKVSIIGKLFLNQKKFSTYSPKLLFVTNASFSFHPNTGHRSYFDATSMDIKHQEKFKEAIIDQAQLKASQVNLSTLRFIQSSLSLDDHMTHLTGKLCHFLSDRYGENTTLNASTLAVSLESECRQKSKFKSDNIRSFLDLVSQKGFSSRAFNAVIDNLNTSHRLQPDWDMAKEVFESLNKKSFQLVSLRATFTQVCIDLSQNKKNASTVYLERANELYDKAKINSEPSLYLSETTKSIDALCPDYEMALKPGKKECIVVYSIIQRLIEEGEE